MFKKDLVSVRKGLDKAGIQARIYRSNTLPRNARVVARSDNGYILALVGKNTPAELAHTDAQVVSAPKATPPTTDELIAEFRHAEAQIIPALVDKPAPKAKTPAKKASKPKTVKGRPAPKADVTLFVANLTDGSGYVRARHYVSGICLIEGKLKGKKNPWNTIRTLDGPVVYTAAKAAVLEVIEATK